MLTIAQLDKAQFSKFFESARCILFVDAILFVLFAKGLEFTAVMFVVLQNTGD